MTEIIEAPAPVITGLRDDQIEKFVERYRSGLVARRDDLNPAAADVLLSIADGMTDDQIEALKNRLDSVDLPLVIEITEADLTYNLPDWATGVSEKPGEDWRPELGTYQISFEQFLADGESYLGGESMRDRAVEMDAASGLAFANALLRQQRLIPAKYRGEVYLVFPGTVISGSDDYRRVAGLRWDGDSWRLGWGWLVTGFGSDGRLVRFRKV